MTKRWLIVPMVVFLLAGCVGTNPTPVPTPSIAPTSPVEPTQVVDAATAIPEASPTLTPAPTPSVAPTVAPTPTALPTATPMPTPTPEPTASPTPAPPTPVPPTPTPASPSDPLARLHVGDNGDGYGFNVWGLTDSAAARTKVYADVQGAGFGWVRQQVSWAAMEPQRGTFRNSTSSSPGRARRA